MYCSKCGHLDDKVIDSRLSKDGRAIRRRRECLKCTHRFTTYEELEQVELRVIKRDGRSEPFSMEKLMGGLSKACDKRPVTHEMLARVADEIVQDLAGDFEREVPSHVVGAKVMARLHELDEVAYVRFASVYREFTDIEEFLTDLQNYKRATKKNTQQPELFANGAPPALTKT